MIDIIRTAEDQPFKQPVEQAREKSFVRISELAEDFMHSQDDFFPEEKSEQRCGNRASVRTGMDDVYILILLQDLDAAGKCGKNESKSAFARPIDGDMRMMFTFKEHRIETRSQNADHISLPHQSGNDILENGFRSSSMRCVIV